jgi:peptidoglycan-N-acetylglucosamine deacetylase
MSTNQFTWPDGCQAAISLTFDDGLPSQLALAIPILNRFDLRGTFYVNPRDNYREQLVV